MLASQEGPCSMELVERRYNEVTNTHGPPSAAGRVSVRIGMSVVDHISGNACSRHALSFPAV